MTEEQKALREAVAQAIAKAWDDEQRTFAAADAAIAVVLERAAQVAETVGPVVIQDNGDGSKVVNTWRANDIAAAIRALIPASSAGPSQSAE